MPRKLVVPLRSRCHHFPRICYAWTRNVTLGAALIYCANPAQEYAPRKRAYEHPPHRRPITASVTRMKTATTVSHIINSIIMTWNVFKKIVSTIFVSYSQEEIRRNSLDVFIHLTSEILVSYINWLMFISLIKSFYLKRVEHTYADRHLYIFCVNFQEIFLKVNVENGTHNLINFTDRLYQIINKPFQRRKRFSQ